MRWNGHNSRGSCHEKSWGPRNGHVAWMRSVTYPLVSWKSYKFYSLFGSWSAAQSFRPSYFLLCARIRIEAKALSGVHCCYDQKIGPGLARTLGVHRSPLLFMFDWWGGNGCSWYYHHCESGSSPIVTATSMSGEFLDILILNILFIATLDEVRMFLVHFVYEDMEPWPG